MSHECTEIPKVLFISRGHILQDVNQVSQRDSSSNLQESGHRPVPLQLTNVINIDKHLDVCGSPINSVRRISSYEHVLSCPDSRKYIKHVLQIDRLSPLNCTQLTRETLADRVSGTLVGASITRCLAEGHLFDIDVGIILEFRVLIPILIQCERLEGIQNGSVACATT